ncbi:protogenin B-like [Scyliorhinus torazame]|uniref:protogenin B-like n=1 Tax=Scyliorhinus torazame TaxID=75743 RepID=UPI003B5C2589
MPLFVIFVAVFLTVSGNVAMAGELTLSVEPQSGSVRSGDGVKFTCKLNGPGPVATMFLYRERAVWKRIITISGKGLQGVFEFQVQRSDEGTYYCVYDSDRFASVAYSNRVTLTVKGSIWPIAMGCRLGVVFILHLVVISVWCWKPANKERLKIDLTVTELTKTAESL